MDTIDLRLPAEWEPQSGVMLTWPHEGSDWNDSLAVVENVFFRIATEIARREIVLVNCFDAAMAERIQARLSDAGIPPHNLITTIVPSDDSWARDHGPLTRLRGGKPELTDFVFNGWGNKYPAQRDNAITYRLANHGVFGKTPVVSTDLILEGGSIDTDGAGTLLATQRCLLHPQRNPGLDRPGIEKQLHDLLGIRRVLWLEHGELEGDDTDGHIDMLARFVSPEHIVYQQCTEPVYPHHATLQAMEAELGALRQTNGSSYQLTALPWPSAKFNTRGDRLPASYANFLVINGAVLLPSYEDNQDDIAAAKLQAAFPAREIVQIPCLPLIQQSGSLHCVSMQFPAAVELRPANPG